MDALGQFVTESGVRVAWAAVERTQRRDVSRTLLRGLLSPAFGDVCFAQGCRNCGSQQHGPLRVLSADRAELPRVSVAYAGSFAIVAAAPLGAARMGIDAELDNDRTRLAVSEALGALDAPDVYSWTRLEAIAKAREMGLRDDWEHPDTQGLVVTDHRLRVERGAVVEADAIALSVAIDQSRTS